MYFLSFLRAPRTVCFFFFSLFYLSGELLALPNRLDGAGVDWNLAANSSLSLARLRILCTGSARAPADRGWSLARLQRIPVCLAAGAPA